MNAGDNVRSLFLDMERKIEPLDCGIQYLRTELPNVEILGSLDMLFKVGYPSLEVEFGDEPLFQWWGLFLVRVAPSKRDRLLDAAKTTSLRIVDNIDVNWFLVQFDVPLPTLLNEKVQATVIFQLSTCINDGETPCIASQAEVNPQLASGARFMHIGLASKRRATVDALLSLLAFCDCAVVVVQTFPQLKVCDIVTTRRKVADPHPPSVPTCSDADANLLTKAKRSKRN